MLFTTQLPRLFHPQSKQCREAGNVWQQQWFWVWIYCCLVWALAKAWILFHYCTPPVPSSLPPSPSRNKEGTSLNQNLIFAMSSSWLDVTPESSLAPSLTSFKSGEREHPFWVPLAYPRLVSAPFPCSLLLCGSHLYLIHINTFVFIYSPSPSPPSRTALASRNIMWDMSKFSSSHILKTNRENSFKHFFFNLVYPKHWYFKM